MLDFFVSDGMRVFSISLGLMFGLLALEILLLMAGFSILSFDADAADIELDVDIETDIEAPLSFSDAVTAGQATSWLGIGKVPMGLWIASALTGFGLSGFVLQSAATGLFDAMLPAMLAIPVAIPPGLFFARVVSGAIARIAPKTETSAVSLRSFGGQHGVITQGTARTGSPAEAKIRDRHGNLHYVRVEPYEADEELPQGTEIYIVRKRDGVLKAMAIDVESNLTRERTSE